MRTCTKCKKSQPLTEFTKHKKEPDGIRKYCRTCAKMQKQAWYERNYIPGSDYYRKVQASGRRRVESGVNARQCREQYQKHREKREEDKKKYREVNRDKVRIWQKMYKARVRGATGFCSSATLQAKIDYYGGKCWLCGAPYQEIDHVKPVSKGGTNWPVNLKPICKPCNTSKGAKWPLEKVFV